MIDPKASSSNRLDQIRSKIKRKQESITSYKKTMEEILSKINREKTKLQLKQQSSKSHGGGGSKGSKTQKELFWEKKLKKAKKKPKPKKSMKYRPPTPVISQSDKQHRKKKADKVKSKSYK